MIRFCASSAAGISDDNLFVPPAAVLPATLRVWMRQGYLAEVDPLHVFVTIWGATQFCADFALVVKLIWDKDNLDEDDFESASEAVTAIIMMGLERDRPIDHQ